MSKIDLTSRGWCDIVFEGRNKEYGAYRMRSRAGRRNAFALLMVLLFIFSVGVIIAVKTVVNELTKNEDLDADQVTELSQLEKKEEPKKEEKKIEVKYEEPKVEKVQVKASIQFTVPKIEDDNLVDEAKEVRRQDEVTKSTISIAAQDYAGDGKGGINIDDLKDNQQAGGTTAPKEEEVMANELVEQPAVYPGGEPAILRFIAENLKYPSIAQDQGLQGTVVLKFTVDKTGAVTDIVVSKSLSRECDKAAVECVSKLKRFTPHVSRDIPYLLSTPCQSASDCSNHNL